MDNMQMSQFFDPAAMAELYAEQQKLQQRQALAQSLMQAQYIPNSGNAGLLAGVASMLRGKFMQNEDEGKVSDLLRRQFDMQNKAAQAQRQQQLADEQRKMNLDIFKQSSIDRNKAKSDKEFAKPELKEGFINWDPATGAASVNPDLQRAMLGMKHAGRPVTNINMANENAFQKALGESDAKDFVSFRQGAQSATDTLSKLGQLKQIMEAQKTGKSEETKALIGQYFGTDAAANMQAFNAAAQPLILEAAKNMKGSLSDKDVAFLKQMAPSFGNDPRANAMIVDMLEKAANKSVKNYQDAQGYVNEHRTLAGFMPSVQPAVPSEAPATVPSAAPGGMADGVTAVNPKTGQRIKFVNGQWVPI